MGKFHHAAISFDNTVNEIEIDEIGMMYPEKIRPAEYSFKLLEGFGSYQLCPIRQVDLRVIALRDATNHIVKLYDLGIFDSVQ